MPIYEYECPTHGRYEHSQRITDEALKTCIQPNCDQPVRKLISQSSFALKGSGWYVTDYGRGNSGSSASARSDSGDSAASGDAAGGCGAGACGAGGCA